MRKSYLPFAMLLLGVGLAGCGSETLLAQRGGQEQPLADPDVCVCDTRWSLVCGSDGRTYFSPCEAACAGVEVVAEGECRPPEEEPPGEEPIEEPPVDDPLDPPFCEKPEGGCIELYYMDPVCGVDRKTYNNPEIAECECVDVLYKGECRDDWVCTQDYDPVCGVDGKTYSNECSAVRQAHVRVAYKGECTTPDPDAEARFCTMHVAPVCGTDGKTYSNACVATNWHNVEVAHIGACGCDCPDVYEPVCVNVLGPATYPNACVAECSGVTIRHEGECEPWL